MCRYDGDSQVGVWLVVRIVFGDLRGCPRHECTMVDVVFLPLTLPHSHVSSLTLSLSLPRALSVIHAESVDISSPVSVAYYLSL